MNTNKIITAILTPLLGVVLTVFSTLDLSSFTESNPLHASNQLGNSDQSFAFIIEFENSFSWGEEEYEEVDSDRISYFTFNLSASYYSDRHLAEQFNYLGRQILFQTDSSPPVC